MLKFAHIRSALLVAIGSIVAAGQPANAEDLIDVMAAAAPEKVLGIFFPTTFRAGGGLFEFETVEDEAYGAALFSLKPALDEISKEMFTEAKNLPTAPGVAAFTYELDPETNTYKRTGDGLGAIYSDRAQTLGKGRLNFGVAWSHYEFDEFEGTSLRSFPVVALPEQAVIVTSNVASLNPQNNGHLSILYPNGGSGGDPFPESGLTWNLPDSNTTGTAPCLVRGGDTCQGDTGGADYHFESFGPVGDYLTAISPSERINVNVHMDVELIDIYLAYGVTDRFDIGLVLPIIQTELDVDLEVRTPLVPPHPRLGNGAQVPDLRYTGSEAVCMGDPECLFDEFLMAHEEKYQEINLFGQNTGPPCFRACPKRRTVDASNYTVTMRDEFFSEYLTDIKYSADGEDVGIGDLLIRGKYHFLESRFIDMAGRVDVSFPTGDKDNFRGIGEYMGAVNLLASKTIGWFSPHVNLGVQIRTGGKENHQFRWAIGADARVHRRGTVSVDFLGSEDLHHNGIGDTQMWVAPAVKFNPWKNLVVSAGALIPVNHQGLRSDVVPTLGVEYIFF